MGDVCFPAIAIPISIGSVMILSAVVMLVADNWDGISQAVKEIAVILIAFITAVVLALVLLVTVILSPFIWIFNRNMRVV